MAALVGLAVAVAIGSLALGIFLLEMVDVAYLLNGAGFPFWHYHQWGHAWERLPPDLDTLIEVKGSCAGLGLGAALGACAAMGVGAKSVWTRLRGE